MNIKLPSGRFGLSSLALVLAALVVLARLYAPGVTTDEAGLAFAFVTACFAIIRGPDNGSPPAVPPMPPATPPAA